MMGKNYKCIVCEYYFNSDDDYPSCPICMEEGNCIIIYEDDEIINVSPGEEEKYVDRIELFLKNCGCKTWREIIPNKCKKWDKPYRVDLIFYRKDFGYIGVEFKVINTLRSGGVIAKAMKQINEKYRNDFYFDDDIKIDKWCIGVKINSINKICDSDIKIFLTCLLNQFDFSFIDFEEYNNSSYNRVSIDRLTKNSIYIKKEVVGDEHT